MTFIDTHCHLFWEDFNVDLAEVIQRAEEVGVRHMIVPATNFDTLKQAAAMAGTWTQVSFSAGIHPHDAAQLSEHFTDTLQEFATSTKCVAIGEIGLDYHYDFCLKPQQQKTLSAQLELAKSLKLPVIVHSRESDQDMLALCREHQDGTLTGQFHCFSSSPEYAERVLDLGFHISFTGNVTFKKSILDDVLRVVPDNRLLIETDAPFMAPAPFRGKRNEPMYIPLIAERFAAARAQSREHIASITTTNACALFGLGTDSFGD